MKVFINKREVTIFTGARLSDAVLAYSKHAYKMLLSNKLILTDRFGNLTEPDGPVTEGQKFRLRRNNQTS